MHITVYTLRELDACCNQVQLFESTFPDGADITAESIALARDVGLDISWLLQEAPALFVEHRDLLLEQPKWAYYYAADVDEQPRNDTRAAAYKEPAWEYQYAFNVNSKD